MILNPIAPVGSTTATTLRLANPDELVYRIPMGTDWMLAQFIGSAWTVGAVVTFEISLDGVQWSAFPGSAETQSALGFHPIMTVTGVTYARIRVSTQAAGTDTVTVLVNVGSDN